VNNTVKVGIFMTIALAVLGYLILRAEQIRLFEPRGRELVAQFVSVAGLDDQAAVRVAGVRVGRVDGITLHERQAMVHLVVEKDVALPRGTYAQIQNLGLLGDKYVELVPGPAGGPEVANGAVIPGQPAFSIDQLMSSVGGVGSSLQQVAAQLAGTAPPNGPLGRLVVNLELTSSQIRELVASNRASLDATVDNMRQVSAAMSRDLPQLSQNLAGLLAEVRAVVADNRGTLHEGLGNVEKVTSDLQTSVDNLNDITGKLARGEGTMGKLLNSDQAHQELVSALQSVQSGVTSLSTTLNRIQKIQLELAMQGFYLEKGLGQNDSHGHGDFSVDIDPQSGHLYRVAISDDPAGKISEKQQTITTTDPEGNVTSTTIDTQTAETHTSISALLGVPLGDKYRLWAGLLESEAGLQADFRPTDQWQVTFQAFDFSRPNNFDPHLRLLGRWQPFQHLYLLGGYDDPLVKQRESFFLGAGIRWRDDDLKYLLGSLPKF